MVLEVRKIILSKGELAMALNAYRKISPNYLPMGKVVGCDVTNDQEVAIDLEVEWEQVEKAMMLKRIKLERPKLTDPLIHFCIDNRIMLPRQGKKSALLTGGLPMLFVELEIYPVLDFA